MSVRASIGSLKAVAGSTALALVLCSGEPAAAREPVGTAFTYQGELAAAGAPTTGTYDIRFRLFDAAGSGAQVGGTLCSNDLVIENGRFAVVLDFGAAFAGQQRFLEIDVRQNAGQDCSDASGYATLSPRQELTATPHASYAKSAALLNDQLPSFYQNAANLTGSLPSSLLSGSYTGPLSLTNTSNVFTGNGAAITNLNATNISTGMLDVERMPLNWAAGGDLTGFYPSPTIGAGTVTLSKLTPGVQCVLSGLNRLTPARTFDAIAWGDNLFGQLDVPALPAGVQYAALAAGFGHSLALRSDGSVVAWGNNQQGQTNVPALPQGVTYTAVASGVDHGLGLRSDGTMVAWGRNNYGQTAVTPAPPGLTYTAVAAGTYSSLALRSDGTVDGWGENGQGQLNAPALPPGLTYSAMAAGYLHSAALRSDGAIVAWGYPELGLTAVPALPNGLTYVAVACGYQHSVALRSDGTVVAWGENTFGSTTVPALPPGVTYTSVAANGLQSIALRSDGTVIAWGSSGSAQLNIPALPLGSVYAGIASGNNHFLALRTAQRPASLGSSVGLSIGSTAPPPADGGIHVAGASSFASSVSATSFSGSGAGLTNLNASNIVTGTLGTAQIPNLDAAKITSGSLNNARTSGASLNTPDTLVLRDPSGNFSAGIISATLNGNAATATTAANASNATTAANATLLNGQSGSFYTNASNLTTGTLADGLLSGNIPRLNVNNTFAGDTQTFAGRIRVNNGAIQKGGGSFPGADLGLYTFTAGELMRFATNNGAFQWFSDNGTNPGGLNARMTLSSTGNLSVTGSLSKGGGSFKIDHPLDPTNKYLYHSFVESPDMMNVYNGNIITDGGGYATITMPHYFEALNRDFRYQLTVINEADTGELLWAQVVRELKNNQFTIRSSRADVKVSWQITGIRHDAWAEKNRIPNSVDKVGAEKGKLLHPEAFNQAADKGVHLTPVASEY